MIKYLMFIDIVNTIITYTLILTFILYIIDFYHGYNGVKILSIFFYMLFMIASLISILNTNQQIIGSYDNKIEVVFYFIIIILLLMNVRGILAILIFYYANLVKSTHSIHVHDTDSTKLGIVKIPAFINIKQFKNDLNNRLAKLKLEDGQKIFLKA